MPLICNSVASLWIFWSFLWRLNKQGCAHWMFYSSNKLHVLIFIFIHVTQSVMIVTAVQSTTKLSQKSCHGIITSSVSKPNLSVYDILYHIIIVSYHIIITYDITKILLNPQWDYGDQVVCHPHPPPPTPHPPMQTQNQNPQNVE